MLEELLERVWAVLRLDDAIWTEIEHCPRAIGQAVLIVGVSSGLAAIGQWGFSALTFLAVAGWIVWWAVTTGLIWAGGAIVADSDVDYGHLLRCTGYASVWRVLALLEGLWLVGRLFFWAALALWLISLVKAARAALHVSTMQAVAICGAALVLPVVFLAAFG